MKTWPILQRITPRRPADRPCYGLGSHLERLPIMIKLIVAAGLTGLLSYAWPALADDSEVVKQKAEQICAACHGAEGKKPAAPDAPRLAGQYDDYLEHAVLGYQSGDTQKSHTDGIDKRH